MEVNEVSKELKESKEIYEKTLLENQTNSSLYLKTLFEYVNFLTVGKEYDLIIKILELPLKEDFIQDKDIRLSISNKLLAILLKVEDFEKLQSALENREELLTKDADFLMQKFYYAVCYEGLNDNVSAIKILESIKDNISNQNLVNKYLKLSMLYLKINEYDLAKKHFKTASIYDKNKKNHTFLLAECDLLIYERNYLRALEVYEDYYIKTNNKYRYLDRYINIQIMLNQLPEAYSFYQKHLPIMKRVLSKQSRLVFYEASLKLMKKLNNHAEEALLESLTAEIEESLLPFTNIHDFLVSFIRNNYDKTFLKPRDIIHALFKEVSPTKLFSKLVYVKLEDGIIKLLHFTKGLLLEKNIENDETSLNVYHDLQSHEYLHVYDKNYLSNFTNDPFMSGKTNYILVKQVRDFEYLVFYMENDLFYDGKKVFDYQALILEKLLSDFYKHGYNYSLLKNLFTIFDQENYGLILLKENNLRLLNDTAKRLLGHKSVYLSMEAFQSRLIKNIYVDELLKVDEVTLKYQTEEIVSLNFKVFKDELDLYLVVRKAEEKQVVKKYYDFKYIYDETLGEDNSIILFNLRDYQDFMKDYSYVRYDNLINKIYEVLRLSSRNYYQNIYLEGMDNLYLILKTKDKRIIKRIYEELFKNVENEVDIRASLVILKDRIEKIDIEDLKYLNSITSKEIRFVQDNKNYRTNKEIAKTILENVNKILGENNIRLSFKLIVDWQSNTYKLIYTDVLNRVLLGNKESLRRVIKANNLESAWDELIISNLVKEARLANFSGKFVVEVSLNTVLDAKIMQRIKKRLNNKGFLRSEIIYAIDYEEFLLYDNLELGKESFVFFNVFNHFNIARIDDLSLMKYIILSAEEIANPASDYFIKMIKDKELTIIYDHQKTSLTKTFLNEKALSLVTGEAYGKFDSLKLVKKLEEKS